MSATTANSLPSELRDQRFVARLYRLRLFGLALGSICVAAGLYRVHAAAAAWVLLVANVFLWPHIAYRVARASRDPRQAETRNLVVDSALGGMWIALIHFSLLPSVVLAVMLSIDKVHVGGLRLLTRTLGCMAATCAATFLLHGGSVDVPAMSTFDVLATLPLLIAYPLATSGAAHALVRRTHELNRRLEQLNRVDAMTGLLNREHWFAAAAHELRRFARASQMATLMMIDIDEFKRINDTYGHAAGDEVIRTVAATIDQCTRDLDLCGRYGGDEFGVVLVGTSCARARLVGERVRARVAALRFEHSPLLRCTVSIGLAEVGSGMHDMRAWLEQADSALYRAKQRGRNRVAATSPTDLVLASMAAARLRCSGSGNSAA